MTVRIAASRNHRRRVEGTFTFMADLVEDVVHMGQNWRDASIADRTDA
jgi:hypothetical protein